MNQCERVQKYMERFGSITTLQAFTDLGVTRLASRICDLKRQGLEIEDEVETGVNRFGEKVHYKKYSLKKSEEGL